MSEEKPQPKPCPLCGKPRDPRYAPFCSRRCADVDLGRWLKGTYVIPGQPEESEDAPPPPAQGADRPPSAR